MTGFFSKLFGKKPETQPDAVQELAPVEPVCEIECEECLCRCEHCKEPHAPEEELAGEIAELEEQPAEGTAGAEKEHAEEPLEAQPAEEAEEIQGAEPALEALGEIEVIEVQAETAEEPAETESPAAQSEETK